MPQQPSDWQTVTPEPNDWQDVSQPATKPESNWFDTAASYIPQPVKSGWNVATKPLTDYLTDSSGNKILDPKAAANYYDVPSENDWQIPLSGGATWKGLGAGMLEGAGNVIKGLSSPLNLATLGAFKGASTLAESAPTIARGMQMAGRAMSAPVALHGGATALNPNSSALERIFGVTELAAGGAGMAAPMPVRPGGIHAGPVETAMPDTLPLPEAAAPEIPVTGAGEVAPQIPKQAGVAAPTSVRDMPGTFTPEAQRAQMMELTQEKMPTTKEGMKARLEQERRLAAGESPTGSERRAFDPNT